MSEPIATVWQIAEEVTRKPQHVHVIDASIAAIVTDNSMEGVGFDPWGAPVPINPGGDLKLVYYELLSCAINYMYWYGASHVRPNQSGATKMYHLLTDSFKECPGEWFTDVLCHTFAKKMVHERFPYSDVRYRQIMELRPSVMDSIQTGLLQDIATHGGKKPYKLSMESWISRLIKAFPNFGQDIFLKRAFLFFGMLNRRYGWFAEEVKDLPIPADYQIPKMLRNLGVIIYSKKLAQMVDSSELVPAGSLMEIEIRASALIACRRLAEGLGWTMMQVDDWLFRNRKTCDKPFHLTITTDY